MAGVLHMMYNINQMYVCQSDTVGVCFHFYTRIQAAQRPVQIHLVS